MNKLTKSHLQDRDKHRDALDSAYDKLEEAVQAYNDALNEKWASVKEALEEYNQAVEDTNSWAADIVSEMDDYMGNKSDTWLEGEKGQAYEEWKQAWEKELDLADIDEPEELEMPERVSPVLEERPEEP